MASTPQKVSGSKRERDPDTSWKKKAGVHLQKMAWISLPVLALLAGLHMQWVLNPAMVTAQAQTIPPQAQVINQRSFNGMYSLDPCNSVLFYSLSPFFFILFWYLNSGQMTDGFALQYGRRRCRLRLSSTEHRCLCLPASHLQSFWLSRSMFTTRNSFPLSAKTQL